MTKSLRATLCALRVPRARSRGAQDRLAPQRDFHAVGVDGDVLLRHGLPVADRLLQHADHPLVALDHRGRVAGVRRVHAGEQVAEGVQHDVGLAERREHLADVAQEGGVRADDEHAAALEDAAVGVEQVGGAVQRGDGLAGARAALDDEDAGQVGADHPVLLGLDGRDHVGHAPGARAAHRGDERRLAGQRAPVLVRQLVQVEDLVVDAGDLSASRINVAAADKADRIARRRGIKGPRGGRAPVNKLQLVIVVAQADSADVKSIPLFVVGAAETQAALGQVELRQALRLLGRRDVPLESCLVGAARAALGADTRQLAHAALSCPVEKAVHHRHVFLLGRNGGGIACRGNDSGVFAVRGFYRRAFRVVFHRAFHCDFRFVFRGR